MKKEVKLRGFSLTKDYSPNDSIVKTLCELKKNGWKISNLPKKMKKTLDSYQIAEEIDLFKNLSDYKIANYLREKIMRFYGDELNCNFFSVFLLLKAREENKDVTLIKAMRLFFNHSGMSIPYSKRKKILEVALSDGVFLEIIDNNGSMKNKTFWDNIMFESIDFTFLSYFEDITNKKILNLKEKYYYNILQAKTDFCSEIIESIITKKKRKRNLYKVKKYSESFFAVKYIASMLNDKFSIKYLNRKKVMREVFMMMESVESLNNFSIYKFDFKNFFESIDLEKEFFIEKNISKFSQGEFKIIKNFFTCYSCCYPGLPTSNACVEIISKRFDDNLVKKFDSNGLIFYKRYVDDGLIILKEKIDEIEIEKILNIVIAESFKSTKVKLNKKKKAYITSNNYGILEYLGYKFEISKNGIKYGISESKIKKYNERVNQIMYKYRSNCNVELLRQRILFIISRRVYYNKSTVVKNWSAQGFIENYDLLIGKQKKHFDKKTLDFLEKSIFESFIKINGYENLPYFFKNDGIEDFHKKNYSFLMGLNSKKSIVFFPNVGWTYQHLTKMINKIDNTKNLKNKSYKELVNIYIKLIDI